MWTGNGSWMFVEQNPTKNWNPEEVEREIEREEEESRALEIAKILTEKAEMLQPKKGMPLKPIKPHVEPNHPRSTLMNRTGREYNTILPRYYTDPANLSPTHLKQHPSGDP